MNEKANINPDIPTAKRPGDYEDDFHEQFYIAEASAGLLFHVVANKELEGINESVIASATYATQKAVGEMSEIFEGLLEYSLGTQKETIKEVRETETSRKDGITELVDAFGDEYPALKQAGTDAINAGTSLEAFQRQVLNAIDLQSYILQDHN